jgi:hypothetical protein
MVETLLRIARDDVVGPSQQAEQRKAALTTAGEALAARLMQ